MPSAILEPLLHSPLLVDYIEELTQSLRNEQDLRAKFLEEMTEDGKWEFINGEIICHSPAANRHISASDRLFILMNTFVEIHQLGVVLHEKALVRFPRNDYEPDIVFFGHRKAALITPEMLAHPAPDLVVEVLSPSTRKNDRGIKFEDFGRHGVAEYWIIDPIRQQVEVFVNQGEGRGFPAKTLPVFGDALVRSELLEGFYLPARAVFESKANLQTLARLMKEQTGP